jgi:hypothetical protein
MNEEKEVKINREPIEIPNRKIDGKTRIMSYVNAVVFFLFLAVGGVLSLVWPQHKISKVENRKLTPLPHFSKESFFKGHYTDSLDLYYADNFPFRDSLVNVAATLSELYGLRVNDVKIYNIAKKDKPSTKQDGLVAALDTNKLIPDSSIVDTSLADGFTPQSVVIFHGKAYQIFGGSKHSAKKYAAMINKYKETLGDSVNVFCLVPPTSTDFYLPSKYKGKGNPEQRFATNVASYLNTNVKSVDAWSELNKHIDEYLYFYTDHHWTGRGAYYGYRAFCESAGFVPYELNQFTRKMNKGFLGSLYAMTQDKRLKENKDSVEMFILPIKTQVYAYSDNLKKTTKTFLFSQKAFSYSAFLGGDHPLMKVVTENKTGRKALLMKDSYGNAIAPYFALHYDEVYIIDYRYFTSSVAKLVKENNITDIVFLHNSFAANNPFTAWKDLKLLNGDFKPKAPPIAKDTTAKVTSLDIKSTKE